MDKNIKELKDKVDNIEKILQEKYCPLRWSLSHLLDCKLDFNLKLNPLCPTIATEAIYIEQMEIRLKASIHEDIKNMERKINDYLRLRLI